MVDLTGAVWGRIDELAADGSPEKAVSVWLQQRMSANTTHKARGIEAITCVMCAGYQDVDGSPFIGPYVMDPTWCSYGWSSPITIPFRLLEGMAQIDLELYASIGYEAVDHDVDYRLELYANGTRIEQSEGTFTGQKGYETYVATLALNTPASYDRWVELRFSIRNEPGAALTAPKSGGGRNSTRQFDSTHAVLTPYQARPATTSHDIIYLSIRSDFVSSNEPAGSADVLFVDPTEKYYGLARPDGTIASASACTYEEIRLQFLQVRAATIRVHYADDVYRAIPPSALPAQVAVRGDLAMRQAYQEQRQWTRDRLVAWGPPGYGYYNPVTESREIRRWRYSIANELTPRPLLDESIQIRGGSKVVVGMYLVSLYYGPSPDSDKSWIEYDFLAALQRRSGGSWSDVETTTRTVQLTTYSARGAAQITTDRLTTPLMYQRGWEWVRKFALSERPLATAEGQLFDLDYELLTFVELELDASSVTNPQDAVRLKITPDYTGSSGMVTGATGISTQAAELLLVGYSVYTRA